MSARAPLLAATLAALAGCALGCTGRTGRREVPPRDWAREPATVEHDAPSVLYAVSDVHGGYERLVALLSAHHLIAGVPEAPGAVEWAAGEAMLVVVGDLVDKGPRSLDTLELVRALHASAGARGGRVVATFGNHEAELLANPENDKAVARDGISYELMKHDLVPEEFVTGDDPRAVWLRARPFAAKVGPWFFAHAGNTKGRTLEALDRALRDALDRVGYAASELIGNDSLLEARAWYADTASTGADYARALGVEHIVFGHDPNALGRRGAIAVSEDGRLFRIDCGMAPSLDNSRGVMLELRAEGGWYVARALTPDGGVLDLWRE